MMNLYEFIYTCCQVMTFCKALKIKIKIEEYILGTVDTHIKKKKKSKIWLNHLKFNKVLMYDIIFFQ